MDFLPNSTNAALMKDSQGVNKDDFLVNIKAASLNYMDLLVVTGDYKNDIVYR